MTGVRSVGTDAAARAPGRVVRTVPVVAAVAILMAGCAERAPATRPESDPSWLTWTVVFAAATLAALVLGALATWPEWVRRRPPLAGVLLAVQAGGLWVGTAVMAGAAVRTGQLLERSPLAGPDDALLRLSSLDGDPDLFVPITIVIVLVGGLAALLTAMGARMASGDEWDRLAAAGVLSLQVLGGIGALGALAAGSRGWPLIVLVANAPLAAAAAASLWWRRPPA